METAQQMQESPANEVWQNFLDGITGKDPVKQKVLQRFAGYCLSRHCARRKFLVLEGFGPCGKSLFVQALSQLFAPEKSWRPDPDDLLKIGLQNQLHGKWLVAIEGWKQVIMQAPTFLRMVDGNYEVRQLYSDAWGPFTGKVVVTASGMVDLLISSEPLLQRMLVVQLHRIHDEDVDPDLAARLATNDARYEIARWAQDGANDLCTIPNAGFLKKEEPWLNNNPLIV